MRKFAFTLAEVLITLAIIGVIAAITIPSIIANHQKRTLETQFAKAYRTLNQVVQLAVAEHGGIDTWEWQERYYNNDKDTFVKKYLLPHLNYVKFCSASQPNTGCFSDVIYKNRDEAGEHINIAQYTTPKVLLADGMSIDFNHNFNCILKNTRCLSLRIDINGHKKPNIFGEDLFIMSFYPQTGEFLPYGINKESEFSSESNSFAKRTQEELRANCLNGANSGQCTALVVLDGFKMNYF